MNSAIRLIASTAILFAATMIWAQTAKPPVPAPPSSIAPSLGTAEKVAIQSLEKTKGDAAKQWQDAQEQELTILREWQIAHPGWHVYFNPQQPTDPKNFSVEADARPEPPKAPVKPPTPAK